MLIKSILTADKNVFDPTMILISGFIGGYTVGEFPPKFLDLIATPVGQFIAYFTILYIYYKDKLNNTVTYTDLVSESVLYVIILQVINFVLHKVF